jgi:hypothetical protein
MGEAGRSTTALGCGRIRGTGMQALHYAAHGARCAGTRDQRRHAERQPTREHSTACTRRSIDFREARHPGTRLAAHLGTAWRPSEVVRARRASRVTVTRPAAGSGSTRDANVACGQSSSAASIWPARSGTRAWLRAAAPAPSAGSPGCMQPAGGISQAEAPRARPRRAACPCRGAGRRAAGAAAHRCGCCPRRSPACPAGRARAAPAARAPPAAWPPPAAPGWRRSARGCRGRRPSPARCAAGPARPAAQLWPQAPPGAGASAGPLFQGTGPRLCSLDAERHGHDLLRKLLFLQPHSLLQRRAQSGAQGSCTGLPCTSDKGSSP